MFLTRKLSEDSFKINMSSLNRCPPYTEIFSKRRKIYTLCVESLSRQTGNSRSFSLNWTNKPLWNCWHYWPGPLTGRGRELRRGWGSLHWLLGVHIYILGSHAQPAMEFEPTLLWPSSRECLRPYHLETTSSRPITEVKQGWAVLVLGWVTAWEYTVL